MARAGGALLALSLLLPLAAPGAALAHERRAVGPFTFVVGFAAEPAIQNTMNGASLRISRTEGGTPVEGADKTLKVQIAAGGGQPKEFALRTVSGQPGLYQADLIPTKSGSYIFTFAGTLDGTAVNQRFESGPGRFNDVTAVDTLQFPALDAGLAPAQVAASLRSAEERAAAAEASAGQGRLLGLGGLIVGLAGLALGGAALLAGRRTEQPVRRTAAA